MALPVYLYSIFVLTILFWLLFGVVVLFTSPIKAEPLTFLAFFACLFSGLWGTFILILFYLRLKFAKKGVILGHLKLSARQAALLSVLLIGLLVFSAFSILNVWTGSLLFVFIVLLELLMRAVK